jgi:hypothetical protein
LFGFVQWDTPIALLLEVLFALAVFIVIFIVVRRVERSQGGGGMMPPGTEGDVPGPRDDSGKGRS